ncbi:hypothetical protein [uncultured Rhodoblastus sp.]|uniref:hypothetical protein n=1 Tax=uncultured Rhodoblastus sp. TaxID=543037 RepID=UPI0025EB75C6|nr:hypothetical protein [uncultured Rhodoblastus sp.]
MNMKDPAALAGANRVRNSIIAAINPDLNPQTQVLQYLRRRFGVTPEVAATLAALAGLGPREARQ